ncbi:hypothetical protein [Nonomuraea helvata]|uniref:Amidohydrolase-related domain-containing protein n=1 Tax=Nonomuraea helvata TaxID=37484 RepID=A0ABV5SCY9_9ACTN
MTSGASLKPGACWEVPGGRPVVAQSLEVAPFAKLCCSSDVWGPAELHHLGATPWLRALARVLGEFVADGEWSAGQAARVAAMVGAGNARRVYDLTAPQALTPSRSRGRGRSHGLTP